MNTVLVQELERFNTLMKTIGRTLQDAKLALSGLAVLTNDLDELRQAARMNRIPAVWLRQSYPSLKPLGSYTRDLLDRVAFFRGWMVATGPPDVYWMSAFFFPPAFLTGARQDHARSNGLAIDRITFDYVFDSHGSHGSHGHSLDSGVLVRGLFFESACWEGERDGKPGKLARAAPHALFTQAPVIWFRACEEAQVSDNPHYSCPCYKTADRRGVLATTGHSSNFVCDIRCPTNEPEEVWVLAGVALLLDLPN